MSTEAGSDATLRLEREGHVARLLIDRPASRNALDQATWLALAQAIEAIGNDDRVKVVILASATPGLFCAGADIREFAAHAADTDWRSANQSAIMAVQRNLARLPIPVIAAIDGDCIGGGCGLALACDLRIAAPAARFGITPAKLGLAYSLHDTKLLVDLVGPGQAKRILFTAGLFPADEAARIGLVELVAADPRAEAEALAATIAGLSGLSVRHAKAMIRRILDGQADDDAATTQRFFDAFSGDDFREGVTAFLERRPPAFR